MSVGDKRRPNSQEGAEREVGMITQGEEQQEKDQGCMA